MIWQELKGWLRVLRYKGQLNSELIYEVIVSPKMPTKIFPISALDVIWKMFGWHFGETMTS